MFRLSATFASSISLISFLGVAASGASQCSQGAGLALVQTRSVDGKVTLAAEAAPINSGDGVFLQVARTGKRLTAQKDGVIHAKWATAGAWERFVIERKFGDGGIQSGDAIFLTAWTGNRLTVGDWQSGNFAATSVHAKWDHKGEWQTLTIVKAGSDGPIFDGDKIFLKGWTGAIVDSDAPDSAAGVVQARWDHMGSWQELVLEAADPVTPTSAASTTTGTTRETKTTSPAPEETTSAPEKTTTTTASHQDRECVKKQSIGQCQPCLKSEQCQEGKYCCPYMKKCVASSSDPCSFPVAQCRPMCYDSMDNSQCECQNADFPEAWQHPTCGSDPEGSDPGMDPTPAPPPKEQPTPAPPTPAPPTPKEDIEVVDAHSWEHFQLVNQLRAEGFTCPKGATFAPNEVPLKFDCRLWKASKLHSEDMAAQNYFSHTSKDGRSPWQRAEEQNTDAHGENIAAGSSNAAATVEQFKKSDGHCKNMMKADFKVMGVGYAHNSGSRFRHYWTQMYSLIDSIDTSCHPEVAQVQQAQSKQLPWEGDVHEIVVGEPWSREQP